ncbi:MAG: divalent-cation tolerance protein CutA [Geminicoccaceae bacterium]
MDAVLLYVTCASQDEATRIGRTVVEEWLAACGNIMPGALSIYRWQGQVCEAGEAILVLKTRTALADTLTRRIRELHSYDCAGITVLPIQGGNPDYLAWIHDSTETVG